MSINYTEQKHYLPAEAFFADVKSGNYYLNELPFKMLSINSNMSSHTLALTYKYNSSFFNFLKRRISSSKSHLFKRFNSLIHTHECDFKSMSLQENSNKFYDLSLLQIYLGYFTTKFNQTKLSLNLNLNLNFKILKSYKRLVTRYKKNSRLNYRHSIKDIKSLPRSRHFFLSTNIPLLNHSTDSMRDI